ncbi:fatty acid desaturase family protein [Nakamurella endophytica]|uniref:Fatty acid desaturase n=1 Tax=Nakamurella endophytica TaxID=1748367 RepID=A0A917T0N4_9ACTN|nr:acyl-CoA desaturase [Nakamurella endophytica]GGM05532.1 fatty acid desaturase [Nakamurella endophytica]
MTTVASTPGGTRARTPRPAHRTASEYTEVLAAVREQGLLRRRYGHYATKIGLALLALAGVWTGVALLGDHWAQLALAAALAVVLTQIIFISHEAAHRQILTSNAWNERVALVLGTLLGGISLSWWQNKHTRHHAAPNQVGKDPDIDAAVVHFFPPERTPFPSRIGRYLHARQGWWFFPVLVVEALNLHVQSAQWQFGRTRRNRGRVETALLAGRLALYPALVFTLLPPGKAGAFLGVQLAVTGVYLGVAFAASHIGMPVLPREARVDFFRRQVVTSRNVAGGRVASLAMGGLNYQIEHHLFPSMPGPALRKARRIVRQYCADRGVTYHEVPIHRAWQLVAAHLNRVGLRAPSFACPVAASLRTV